MRMHQAVRMRVVDGLIRLIMNPAFRRLGPDRFP